MKNVPIEKGSRNLFFFTSMRDPQKRFQEPFFLTERTPTVTLPRMGRPPRAAVGGLVHHVINRGNNKMVLFETDGDYAAFESIIADAVERYSMRLCAYCLMPNHWHLLLWPRQGHDNDLSLFVGWLTLTHSQRRHAFLGTAGTGHIYQGRFKSFPVETDEHFLTVARYVERNALRANLVERAEDWRWCSLWARRNDNDSAEMPALSAWPVEIPMHWLRTVNASQSEAEEQAIRRSITRSTPFGSEAWTIRTAEKLGLDATIRPRGRPRKHPE